MVTCNSLRSPPKALPTLTIPNCSRSIYDTPNLSVRRLCHRLTLESKIAQIFRRLLLRVVLESGAVRRRLVPRHTLFRLSTDTCRVRSTVELKIKPIVSLRQSLYSAHAFTNNTCMTLECRFDDSGYARARDGSGSQQPIVLCFSRGCATARCEGESALIAGNRNMIRI
jgi:hypothetical protein